MKKGCLGNQLKMDCSHPFVKEVHFLVEIIKAQVWFDAH